MPPAHALQGSAHAHEHNLRAQNSSRGGRGVRAVIAALVFAYCPPIQAEPTAASNKASQDILVFHDGNRATGRLIERANGRIVFSSERFGLINISETEAEIIADSNSLLKATPAQTSTAVIPDVLSATAQKPRSPWEIQLNLSLEVKRDGGTHRNINTEIRTSRQWTSDELRFGGRYENTLDNSSTNTDILKGDAYWRHDCEATNRIFFTLYNPTLEWNRSFHFQGIPLEYIYLKQPLGFGWNILRTQKSKMRLGIAENFLDLWAPDYSLHVGENVESMFLECEFQFPYRISISNRGIWFHSFHNGDDGWENDFELKKLIGESFSVSLRQELRRDTPEVNVSNYSMWRIWFGYHF